MTWKIKILLFKTKRDNMPLLSAGLCDIGQKRKTNQDSIYLNPERNIYVVADGMGGHNGGDIASALAVKHVPEYILGHLELDPKELLINSIRYANDQILNKAKENSKLVGMGTTVVSMIFKGQHLFIGNVGDSRTYMINRNRLFQMTKDHSLVQEKLNMGIYNREQAAEDPQKNVLVRTVGFEEDIQVDVYTYKVSRNDIFLCCSDGLHGAVSDQDILYLINQYLPKPEFADQKDVEKCVEALVAQANKNGGHDNISTVVVVAK